MKANTTPIHTNDLFRRTFKGILSFGLMATITLVGSESYAESDSYLEKQVMRELELSRSRNQLGELRLSEKNIPSNSLYTPRPGDLRERERNMPSNSVSKPTAARSTPPAAPKGLRVIGVVSPQKSSVAGGTQNIMSINVSATNGAPSGTVVDLTK